MVLQLKQSLSLSQQLIMTPQLQQAIKLLQLSRLELLETITQEMETNPLLDEHSVEEVEEEKDFSDNTTESVEQPTHEVTIEEKVREDIDWERKTLQVQRQALRHKGGGYEFTKPKSKSGIRTIILGDKMLEILREHKTDQWERRKRAGENWVELDLIFPSRIGTPVVSSNLRRSFRKLLAESGLPKIRFHDLRHTAASLMLNYGIPVIIVSRRLGHAKPSITLDVYGHLIPSKQEEAAALMDELLTPIDVSRCTIFAPDKRK